MNKKQFWATIDRARKAVGGWHGMYEPLQAELSGLDVTDIMTWYLIFEKYRELAYKQKLWAAAAAMMNGCSDDSFDYFRGWLIAQGKDVYLAALRDPDSLADVEAVKRFAQEVKESKGMTPLKGYYEEPRFEKILVVADYAFQRKTGNVGFYRYVFNSSLLVMTCQAIEREIVYAPDMDVAWFDIDLPPIEIEERLRKLTPKLYQAFHSEETP